MSHRDERSRLARRAAGGDVEAARWLVVMLSGSGGMEHDERTRLAMRAASGDAEAARALAAALGSAAEGAEWLRRERSLLTEALMMDPALLLDLRDSRGSAPEFAEALAAAEGLDISDQDPWMDWVDGIWRRLSAETGREALALSILAAAPDAIRERAKHETTALDDLFMPGPTPEDPHQHIVLGWATWVVALYSSDPGLVD